MKKILRLLIAAAAAVVSAPLAAQQGANTVLTGVEGVPWGATREQVEAKLGAPDSTYARGDTISLIYWRRPAFGMTAMMEVGIQPGAGMNSAAYLVRDIPADCTATFDRVVRQITDAHAGLKPDEIIFMVNGIASADHAGDCRRFAAADGPAILLSRFLRDPTGPGNVFLFSTAQSARGMVLVAHFTARPRARR